MQDRIVAIGSSTGGPTALHQVLQKVNKDFQTPILVVQHLPSNFTNLLANRLNGIGNLRVKEAEHGEEVNRSTVYIAPGDFHMLVKSRNNKLMIHLTKEKHRLGHRPSVNMLFDSIAELKHIKKTIVIMTGMGKDGAEGIIRIKENDENAVIIAESSETAVVNGMPSAAIATNHVTEIVRLERIGEAIMKYSKR